MQVLWYRRCRCFEAVDVLKMKMTSSTTIEQHGCFIHRCPLHLRTHLDSIWMSIISTCQRLELACRCHSIKALAQRESSRLGTLRVEVRSSGDAVTERGADGLTLARSSELLQHRAVEMLLGIERGPRSFFVSDTRANVDRLEDWRCERMM